MRARPLIVSDQAYTKLRANIIGPVGPTGGVQIGGNYFQAETFTGNLAVLPVGLQRYAEFYSQYNVLGTKISVSPIWNNPAVGVPLQYSLYPRNENDQAVTVPREVAELPYSRFNLYRGPQQSRGQVLSSFMNTNKITGQKTPYARIEDQVSGEFSGSAIIAPARIWIWEIGVTAADGTTLSIDQRASLLLQVRVTYYVRFFGRVNFQTSDPQVAQLDNKFESLYSRSSAR